MFTAQGAQLPLRTKSAAKVLLFFDIGKRSCDFFLLFFLPFSFVISTLRHIVMTFS